MFNFSQIKNKSLFFLYILLLFTCSEKIYGNPIGDAYKSLNSTMKDNPLLMVVVSTIIGKIITTQIDTYYEDPQLKNLTIEKKKKDLELKSHPNYIATHLLEKNVEIKERNNEAEKVKQDLVLTNLERRIHVESRIEKFGDCAKNGITAEERKNCQMIHDSYMSTYEAYFSTK
jgi:hypothetical protein